MKTIYSALVIAISASLTSCAITSGFQTYDLPDEGVYQTELGTTINVFKIRQDTINALQPAVPDIKHEVAHLFQSKPRPYLLSPGDVLSIYLWAYPEITPATNNISNEQSTRANGFQIDQNGDITFPVIGRYHAAGKSLAKVQQDLRQRFSKYLKHPDVVVRVLSYQGQYFSVMGAVAKGGQFYLTDQPTSVYAAIGMAGGVNATSGNHASLTLVRHGVNYPLNAIELERAGLSLHQLQLQANDTLYVNARENEKVYVLGEAEKNQSIILRDQGMSLGDVLGESLGIDPLTSSRSKIYVIRTHPNLQVTEMFHLDLSHLGDFGLANQFKMRSNDIVYVDVSGLARWQRVINQVIPFSNIIYNIDRLGQ